MNKKIIIPAVALAFFGITIFGVNTVSAHGLGAQPEFVVNLAQKLGVSEDSVKNALDQIHQEHRADMQVKFEERLNQAVTDGKITEEQKQLILQKHSEIMEQRVSNHEALQNMTPDERREAMKSLHTELESWATEHGIDLSYFRFEKRMGMREGREN